MTHPLRIGTRGSRLALWQANHVAGLLRPLAGARPVDIVEIQTTGDRVRDVPLSQVGGEGVFTKEIQYALKMNQIDVAVHSLKDLPTFPVEGLLLAAVPARGPVADVFVSLRHRRFDDLPVGAVIATSSPRRRALVLHRRPDLRLVDMRGNVETRLRKLQEQDLDGLILAQAGLDRLGLAHAITEALDSEWMLPAVGQGALGIECQADDAETLALVSRLDDPVTRAMVTAERSLLHALGGGCQVPIGAITVVTGSIIVLRGVVLSPDGHQRIEKSSEGSLEEIETLGLRLANRLLEAGARKLLAEG